MPHPATFIALLGALAPASASSSAQGVACQAATNFAEEVLARSDGRPRIFSFEVHPYFRLRATTIHWVGPGPPPASAGKAHRELVKRWSRRRNVDAVTQCPPLRRLLETRNVAFGPEAVAAAVREQRDGLFAATIESLTLPVVSNDGGFALLISQSQAGGEAGGGVLFMLERRPDGRWKVIGHTGLWIS